MQLTSIQEDSNDVFWTRSLTMILVCMEKERRNILFLFYNLVQIHVGSSWKHLDDLILLEHPQWL